MNSSLNSTIYIVRHGETIYNVQGIIQGHLDSPLTEKGIEQAQELGKEFKDIHFDAVFSSDLARAQKTAEIVSLNRKIIVTTSELLRERRYGNFEGKKIKILEEANKKAFTKIAELSEIEKRRHKIAPDVESVEEITHRFMIFLREIAVAYKGKNVLVVSHGGVIKSFLNHVLWVEKNTRKAEYVKNTGYIKILCDGVDFKIDEVKGIELSQ